MSEVRKVAGQGMVTVRGDLSDTNLRKGVAGVTGLSVPEQGQILFNGPMGLGWMSPDELLVLTPDPQAEAAVRRIALTLGESSGLAVDVSDARAMFSVQGPDWRDTLSRLTPADVQGLKPGQLRRTRLAQVAGAVWMDGTTGASVVCFRSVADYVEGLLRAAAAGAPVTLNA